MKTNLDRNLTYFILGLPRSGTTIVASLFNSLDDGFCLGEPHWYVESGHDISNVGADCCGKMGDLWRLSGVKETRDIFSGFIKPAVVVSNHYHLGGYKETWRGDGLGIDLLLAHVSLVDFFIVVLRDPGDVWHSQIRVNWPQVEWTIDRAAIGHAFLTGLSYHPKAALVHFDDFRASPLHCVNMALAGRFEIEGPLALRPTGWVYGDPRANKSREIQ